MKTYPEGKPRKEDKAKLGSRARPAMVSVAKMAQVVTNSSLGFLGTNTKKESWSVMKF